MRDVLHILTQKGTDVASFGERDASIPEEDITVVLGAFLPMPLLIGSEASSSEDRNQQAR